MRRRFAVLLAFLIGASSFAGSNPPHPEGLLLRAPDSTTNQRGDNAVLNGVSTTIRLDSAGEFSDTLSKEELAPLVQWYKDRGHSYFAYATFIPGVDSAVGYLPPVSSAGRTIDLDGNEANPIMFLEETYDQIVQIAKDYVDVGVDAIEYDVAWVTFDAGPFDPATMEDFRLWINARYSESDLQGRIDPSYNAANFDYGQFLRDSGVTTANYTTAIIGGSQLFATQHWRLWSAYLRHKERSVVSSLVDTINTYALAETGREIGIYFNRHGYFSRSADRWFLSEYASGDVGEVWFEGVTWDYPLGYTLEPLLRATLKTYDNRFEPWNSPTQGSDAAQSVFLAEVLANNGVGTWYDNFPGSSGVARMAARYDEQLDHPAVSDVAIFYPLATALHTMTHQIGTKPFIGGSHYWYLGLGYLMQDLNLNYDVAFGGDGLGMPDNFTSADLSGYQTVFVSEAIQTTDSQFTEILDYVNGGGTLLVTGTGCFRYDALGDDCSSTRVYDGKTWSDIFGSVGNTTIGSGSVKVLSLDPWGSQGFTEQPISSQLNAIKAGVIAALPSDLPAVTNGSSSGLVRSLRYRDESDDSEIYHLINYTFDFLGTLVTTQTSFTFDFPTPNSFSGTPIAQYVHSAEGDPVTLPVTDLGGGKSQVTIPTLTDWGILRIGSAIDADPHPEVAPIAYFNTLPDNQVFSVEESRTLTYSAIDDTEISSLQIRYQWKDPITGLYGPWTLGDSFSGFETNDLRSNTLNFDPPEEGHYRIQLVATDDKANSSGTFTNGYDTLVGYDTTEPDRANLVMTPNHGVANDGVIASPINPSFTFSGVEDLISGILQYSYQWTKGGNTISEGNGDYASINDLDFPAIADAAYDQYELLLRFQNGAGIWDANSIVYSLIYTLAPSYNGTGANETRNVNDALDFTLDYTSVFGDVSIQWHKNGVPVAGATSATLSFSNLSESDAGTYSATIVNPGGEVTSPDFVLSVNTPLRITTQPTSVAVEEGDPFTLNVEAVGTGIIRYQWKRGDDFIDSATQSSYTVAVSEKATDEGSYSVVVIDDVSNLESDSVLVSINLQGNLNLTAIVSQYGSVGIDINSSETVAALKSSIAASSGFDANEFTLYRGSSELDQDNQTLEDAGLQQGDQITAVISSEVPGSSYASWQLSRLGEIVENRLPSEDANSDGIENFVHYALGLPAGESYPAAGLLKITREQSRIEICYFQNNNASEATIELFLSTDEMQTWQNAATFGMAKVVSPTPDTGVDEICWFYPLPIDDHLSARLDIHRIQE